MLIDVDVSVDKDALPESEMLIDLESDIDVLE